MLCERFRAVCGIRGRRCAVSRKRSFGVGVALLSLVNIVLRMVGVSFQAYISRKIGAEAMGLMTLVMSVYGFAVTVALSGIPFATVRLTADRCTRIAGSSRAVYRKTVGGVVRSAIRYSLLFGMTSGVGLFALSDPIARYLLHEPRTISCLRLLACTLPAIALSAALSGVFTGLRKNGKNAALALLEQGMKIAVTVTALGMICRGLSPEDPRILERLCLAVIGGSAIAEGGAFLAALFLYCVDSRIPHGDIPQSQSDQPPYPTAFRDTASIALPTAAGAYCRQGLTTAEHLAIPRGLKKSGLSGTGALAAYGILQGMALPVILFPYAVIGAFTGMLVPEVTALDTMAQTDPAAKKRLCNIIRRILLVAAIFSGISFTVFFLFADPLGRGIYHSTDAARYIRLLSPLTVFMYMDTVIDAILKGMGEQVYCMKVNILDAGISLVLVMLFTPILGIGGYILSLYVCEILNLACSAWKLWDRAG